MANLVMKPELFFSDDQVLEANRVDTSKKLFSHKLPPRMREWSWIWKLEDAETLLTRLKLELKED